MRIAVITFITYIAFSGCSIQELVIDQLADVLAGSGDGSVTSVFLGDDDPQLVADALPLAIKIYETLLSLNPEHEGLLLTTGSLYVMYANAFIQIPASMYDDEAFEEQVRDFQRAKKLYLRGRDILSSSMDVRYPGFTDALLSNEGLDSYIEAFSEEDVALMYWLASAWFGPVSIDSFDFEILLRLPAVIRVLDRAYELEPEFGNGSIEELYIAVYAALPADMGGGRDKSREAFERVVAIQQGSSAGPYVSLALSVARLEQDVDWFVELMETALAIEVDDYPQNRLINTIHQERASWYLERLDDFFIF